MGGNPQTFARLFMVPGMNHCAGGPATSTFDPFTPIVTWVENGVPRPQASSARRPPLRRGQGAPGRCAHSRSMQTTMGRATPTTQATSLASDANCGDARRIASSILLPVVSVQARSGLVRRLTTDPVASLPIAFRQVASNFSYNCGSRERCPT